MLPSVRTSPLGRLAAALVALGLGLLEDLRDRPLTLLDGLQDSQAVLVPEDLEEPHDGLGCEGHGSVLPHINTRSYYAHASDGSSRPRGA
jgi:hypothetical protein